jgi:hypothetical protein
MVLSHLFSVLTVDRRDALEVVAHAAGSSKDTAERAAAAAGDSLSASVALAKDIDRNVSWLTEVGGDVALLGKRARVALKVPDLSPTPPFAPSSDTEARDLDLLSGYANSGVDLSFASGYIPTSTSGEYPPLRNLFQRVRPAVLSLLAALVSKGQAVVLPLSVARELTPVSNSIPVHWVVKPSNVLGRLIADASGGAHPPNGPSGRAAAASHFGPIDLPREQEVAAFLLESRRGLLDPVLSSDDVSGAFSRLWLSTSSAAQSVLELALDDGMQVGIVLTSMYFGGSSCPFAWQVVSRVLSRSLALHRLRNVIYVDDVLRIGERSSATADGELAKRLLCDILTPGSDIAWAEDKAQWGLDGLVYIGWTWDITSNTVSITKRAAVRFMLRLLRARGVASISVRDVQGLASLGSRFSGVITNLRAITFVLYDRISGVAWKDVDSLIPTTPLFLAAIEVLISFVAAAWNEGVNWSTPLERLVPRVGTVSFQFDGSPSGVGGVCPPVAPMGCPAALVHPFAYSVAFSFGPLTSSEQNSSELIAVVIGLACAVKLGLRHAVVDLVGDSRTALSWVATRIRSERALRAYLVFLSLLEEAGLAIGATFWLDSKTNLVPDGLSRGESVRSFPALVNHVDTPLPPEWLTSLLSFVDPTVPIPISSPELIGLFATARALVRMLM